MKLNIQKIKFYFEKFNIFVCLFVSSVFFASFYYLDKDIHSIETGSIFYLWLFIFLVILFISVVKYSNKKILYFLVCLFLILSGILYYSHSYIKSLKEQERFFASNLYKKLSIRAIITSKPIFINDQIILKLRPKMINNLIDSSIFSNDRDISILMPAKLYDFKEAPEYRDFFEIQGTIRKLSKTERLFLNNLGFKSDIFFTFAEIEHIEYLSDVTDSWFFALTKVLRNTIFDSIYSKDLAYQKKSEVAFLRGLFFGDFSNLGIIYKGENNSVNPLFFFIYSHFYIWFLLILSFIISYYFKAVRPFIHILSIVFIIFLNAMHMYSFNILAPSLIVILFLLFSTYMKPSNSIVYSINYSCLFLILIDPFIWTDKWFLYFVSFSFVVICIADKIDRFFLNFLQGWKFWGFILVMLIFSYFGLLKFSYMFMLIFFLMGIVFFIFLNFLQRKYPIENLNYSEFNILIRTFIASWFAIYFLSIIPLCMFYTNPIDISSIILFTPIVLLLILIFQFGFIGLFIGFMMIMLLPDKLVDYVKWFNIFSIVSIDILEKCLLISTMYFSEKYTFFIKSSYLYIIFYAIFLFLIYKFANRSLFTNLKNIFRSKKNTGIFIFIGFIMFFVGIYFYAKSDYVCIKTFDNDFARFVDIKLPKNERIFIIDILSKNYRPVQFKIDGNYANRDFFSKHQISSLDLLIIEGIDKNPESIRILADMFNGESIKVQNSDKFNIFHRLKYFKEKKKLEKIKSILGDLNSQNIKSKEKIYLDFREELIDDKNSKVHLRQLIENFNNNFDLDFESLNNLENERRIYQKGYKNHIFSMYMVGKDIIKIKYDSDTIYLFFSSYNSNMQEIKNQGDMYFRNKSFLMRGYEYFEIFAESLKFDNKLNSEIDKYFISDKFGVKMFGNRMRFKGYFNE